MAKKVARKSTTTRTVKKAKAAPTRETPRWACEVAPTAVWWDALDAFLKNRGATALHNVHPVLHHGLDDAEHVHQLRVAARRLTAVLRLIELSAPSLNTGKLGRSVRKLRRICGEARDLDVRREFLVDLAKREGAAPGIADLIQMVDDRRHPVQSDLQRRLPLIQLKLRQHLDNAASRMAEFAVDSPFRERFKTVGLRIVAREVRDFWKLVPRGCDVTSLPDDQLHELRIAGKRFRYAAELAYPLLPPEFLDTLYPQLQQVQDLLGQVQDSAVLMADLAEMLDSLKEEKQKPAEEQVSDLLNEAAQAEVAAAMAMPPLQPVPTLQSRLIEAAQQVSDECQYLADKAKEKLKAIWPAFSGAKFRDCLEAIFIRARI